MDLDIKNQVIKLIGYISFVWTDSSIAMGPELIPYGGIKDILLPENKVWKPDIAIYNSVDERVYMGTDESLVTVGSNGIVRWEPVINMGLTCKVDISQYPFDQNTCTINVMTWMNDNTSVNLIPANIPIIETELLANGQFWIKSSGTETIFAQYYGKYYFELHFKLILTRRPNYLILTLLVPVTLLAVLCVVSFLLSPDEPEKVSVAITVLLSFTVFLGVVDNDLPETSDQLCLIVAYVVILLVLSFFCVAGNAVVVVVHKRCLKRGQQSSATLHHTQQTYANNALEVKTTVQSLSKSDTNENIPVPNAALNENTQDSCPSVGQGQKPQVELTRAHRLNKYCLLINSLALGLIVIVFFTLMIK
ncbi:Acetylcholine receptor subunit alpha-type acr-16 [Bulinus truncatus]|nr:Acetylcholine receptor subunit alpha-type acr-16 [Bulinus truncatus]